MTDQEKYTVPRRLDDVAQFFLWDADVAILVIVLTLLGSLFSQPIPGIVLGIGLARLFARIKADGGAGILIHFLYWYTPSKWWIKTRAPSDIREYS